MGTRIRHIVTSLRPILAVCIVSLVLHGCTRDDVCRDDIPDDIVQVGFRIKLNDGYGTRAGETHSDAASLPLDYDDLSKYEPGTGYENYVGIADRDFSFLLFDESGKFVETMTVLGIFPAGDGEYPPEYTVLCSLTKKPGNTFKVMALANWGAGNYPSGTDLTAGVTTIRDICEDTSTNNIYVYRSPFTPSTATPIPMYGVKTCNNVVFEPDKHNDIGDLYLLRAMAKVEVVCKEGSGLELASVRLTSYSTKGFRTPTGMYDNTTYVARPHIPDNAATDDTASLDFRISENKAVIYIPEFRNTGTSADDTARHCRLSVTFADDTEQQYTVDFREYQEGKPEGDWFDILRNCCYRFTVDKKPGFEVDVRTYGESWLDPVFGLDK